MNFVLERIVDPATEPVTLAQAIQQVREFSSASQATQDQLSALIVNAREWVEDETGHALMDQRWRLTLGDNLLTGSDVSGYLPYATGVWAQNDSIYLRRTPVIALTKFVSVASDGTETAIAASAYSLLDAGSKWPRIVSAAGTWTDERLLIEYRAGYADMLGSPTGSAADVPQRFKQAILLHVEAHYNRDEKMMDKLMEAACHNVARLNAHIPFA